MNDTLEVYVLDGKLVISIGIDTLAWAAEHSDYFNPYLPNKGNWLQTLRVSDHLEFAKDIATELRRENEDGSSPITLLLDKMIVESCEQGSLGIEETNL